MSQLNLFEKDTSPFGSVTVVNIKTWKWKRLILNDVKLHRGLGIEMKTEIDLKNYVNTAISIFKINRLDYIRLKCPDHFRVKELAINKNKFGQIHVTI